jgi:hypothetical protein
LSLGDAADYLKPFPELRVKFPEAGHCVKAADIKPIVHGNGFLPEHYLPLPLSFLFSFP